MSYEFQFIPRADYPPHRETVGEATMRLFGAEARPMGPDEDTCERCGYIRREGTSATHAHDELCDLVIEEV